MSVSYPCGEWYLDSMLSSSPSPSTPLSCKMKMETVMQGRMGNCLSPDTRNPSTSCDGQT